ncbi:hypothetical protein [Pedobacter sp. V48]|uniref:hypothetical protein n=1 Tax=Pedobacter sp. V48 TaxID=509635 RepID=UPI0003E4BB65|nr:hypothetical protein [Pedobacter sp. V48]ETZ24319.1 hypothetical protein N824_14315 [Pedobacter sp. V48]
MRNYPPEYLGTLLNEAFATDLDGLIEQLSPDYWIYGHHHRNIEGFKIVNTNMLTNQLGYVHHGEAINFSTNKSID